MFFFCSEIDHNTAYSRECRNYKKKLDKVLKDELGEDFERFTHKLYLESVIKPDKKELFVEKVTKLVLFMRNVLFRPQIFVNTFVVRNSDSPDLVILTQQNFWYSISQLTMGESVSKTAYVSDVVVLSFDCFRNEQPAI